METGQDRKNDECRVVVGPEETAAARFAWPDVPIVALVEASEPDQAVYARSAGADIVLPTTDLASGWRRDTPGLAVAVSAATSLAERRSGVREASRRSAHDLGQALSAINLAAELAIGDSEKNDRLLYQIQELVQDAGADAWRAGRGGRSPGSALRPVDLSALLHRIATAEPDVVVFDSSGSAWVLGDVGRIEHLLEELIQHGRRSATGQRVDVTVADASTVVISIRGTGSPRPASRQHDVEFELLAATEIVNDLGGRLRIDQGGQLVAQLSLPLLPYEGHRAGLVAIPPDRMAIQTNILEAVLRHAPLPESLEAIVVAIEQQLPGSKCSVLLLDDSGCLHHGAGASLPEAYRQEIDGVPIGFGQGSCGTAAFLGRPVIVSDVATDHHWVNFKDLALEHDLRSCWSTPILAADGGAVMGTFAVYRSEVWEPDDAATRLVSRFTYLAAVAIGHHRLFNALAESESRFRSAFEGATAGMALVGLDGSFLKVNPALSSMLGKDASDLCESNALDLLDPADQDQIVGAWREILAQPDPSVRPELEPIEVAIVDHAGDDPLWVSMRSSLVRAENDDQPYLYVELRDITASRRHAVERRARETAEAASQAKTDFLALVSHELRTPLNAILGFAQLMKLVDLDASDRSNSVDNILTAGQHLLELINELLDLSLIEAGQVETQIETVDADEAIEEALQILGPLANTRNIDLRRGLSPALTDTAALGRAGAPSDDQTAVRADRQYLRQVLMNLVGNALKFTPTGGQVSVMVNDAEDHNTVRIRILDSGPGIPAEAIENLFQPFRRLASGTHPEAEGTGLGLSVAARLAKAMHGNIGVESRVGAGSCFWIDLPASATVPDLAVPRLDELQPAAPTVLEGHPTAGVVLYVEDDPASVQVVAATLALRPGITFLTATCAAEAEAAVQTQTVDAILLDIGLPDSSGWDLLTSLKHAPATSTIPVVVLTAGSTIVPPGTPQPDRIMAKPLDISACLETIDALLAPPGLVRHG